ncbi:hypothetical protein ScPMuIL_014052 [Solemya velum]
MAAVANAPRHILLTGPPGVGKTTLVHKACEALTKRSVTVHGFYTEEIRTEGKRVGFDVVTLAGIRAPLARVCRNEVGQRSKPTVGQYSVEVSSFEQAALQALRGKGEEKSSVRVIDEIGKMELFSPNFIKTVRSLLDRSDTTVLATIPIPRGKPIPFVEDVRSRKDALVITISKENRNKVLEEIVSAIIESTKVYQAIS